MQVDPRVIDLYNEFIHSALPRRDFMARLTKIVGSPAAAAAVLETLDTGQLGHAFGLSATQMAGVQASGGSMAKPFHVGKAAMNGVMAAQLARDGMEAEQRLLDLVGRLPPGSVEECVRGSYSAQKGWFVAIVPTAGVSCALGGPNAMSIMALADPGAILRCPMGAYMDKIATGPDGRDVVDLDRSPAENLKRLAQARRCYVEDLTVVILDRPRHDDLIGEIRDCGARVISITDGDVAGAISTAWPNSGADILFGIGGTPEGVIAAAALKGLGGEIQGVLHASTPEERERAEALGYDFSRVLTTDDLVQGDNCYFSATAITDGDFLRGVRFTEFGATTQIGRAHV